MEHQSLTSHPNSPDSSPNSRELLENNDHRSPFDEHPPQPPPSNSNRVKLMCSYGGKIQPRLHDHHFTYIGGDTKILTVDRSVKLTTLVGKLSTMANCDVCFKYQLPGEDLDALISVCNEEDLDHMMIEYDRLGRVSPKPARLRLFLFPAPVINNKDDEDASADSSVSAVILAAVEDSKSEGQWFIDALNSANVPPLEESPPPPPTLNPDYLFGLDKPYSDTPSAKQAEFPVTVPDFPAMETECGPETVKETEIQELERMEFVNIEQEVKVDGENGGINGVFDCHTEENAEKVIPLVANEPEPVQSPTQTLDQIQIQPGSFQVQIPEPVPVQSMFSPVRHHNVSLSPGGYSMGYTNEPAPVYLIQTSSGLYQALRPVTGPHGQPVYFAYTQIVNQNQFGYNGSGVPGVVSEHGYSNGGSYVSDRSALPL
ncbi:PB1 domain protein [Trifolium pratense]|uniref:PB1 domain protein n=2 Tax=Trifolium pratense TaxID=57577 RepID=A0A2K3NCT3_TRIPR|nr:uncharacterized protein LOC123920161 [Trifolium pratense]PNY00829.1 PB1 domain protein [Trifolium pratense]CAJ2652257.1 unnamed protein product [Trifolium pratense]